MPLTISMTQLSWYALGSTCAATSTGAADVRAARNASRHSAGVRTVFAGHYHRNAVARDGDLEMVTTGPVGKPLGADPSGFRIVIVTRDSIMHRYYALDSVPERLALPK